MKKLSFLIAIFAIFLPFSASFASNLFTLSEINIPKIITIDEQSKYSASGVEFQVKAENTQNIDGKYCVVQKRILMRNNENEKDFSLGFYGSCALGVTDMSPMFRDMDLFRNSSYTSQYFQSEDIKQIKIEFYITEDRLYNPPVSNILSFTIVPTNTDINSVSEGVTTTDNITSNCTVNGEKVDCAEMVKTAKSWFKAGLWSLLIFGIIFIIGGIFWLIMLIHAISNPIPNKVLWILIIFFLSFLGAVIYYFVIKRNYIPTVIPSGIDPIHSLNMGIAPAPVAPAPVAPAPVAPAPVAPGNTMNPPLAK